jgi:hypothetical protein
MNSSETSKGNEMEVYLVKILKNAIVEIKNNKTSIHRLKAFILF